MSFCSGFKNGLTSLVKNINNLSAVNQNVCIRNFTSLRILNSNDKHSHGNYHAMQSNVIVPQRGIKKRAIYDNRRVREEDVLKRFWRLGNGLWVRRQQGYNRGAWKRLELEGIHRFRKLREHLIVNEEKSKMLDNMVSNKWKKHYWTVTDPYKGFDEECKYFYNPYDTPNLEKYQPEYQLKYANYRDNLHHKEFERQYAKKKVNFTYQRRPQDKKPNKKRTKLSSEGYYGVDPKSF